jgi:polar amino acid transport system substrate-binding protein
MGNIKKVFCIVILFIVIIDMISACSSGSDNSLDRIKKAGFISIATSSGYPPFCFYNSKNELVGYDVDVAKEIAKRLGVKLKLIDTEWKNIINGLNTGAYDGIVGSMSVTDERGSVVSFSTPYYHSKSFLVVRRDSPFKSRSDLIGKTVGVEDGTVFESDAKALGEVNIKRYKTSEQALTALDKKLLDAVITDEIVVNYVANMKKLSLETLGEPLRRDKVAVALRKGDNALLKKVNEILKAMQDDGTFRKLSAKIVENRHQ